MGGDEMADEPEPIYEEPPEWFSDREREMWFRMAQVEAKLKTEQNRAAMLVEAIQSERREREIERAMWKDNVALQVSQTAATEQDIAEVQNVLAIVAHVGGANLRALLEWAWNRSTPEELVSMRGQRDALWQMVGMLELFARPRTEGE